MSVLPTPPLYSSGEGHGGGVGSPGSPIEGSDSHCLVVSAEWAWSCPECGLSNFPVPSRGSGVLQVKGTM